jgi:aminopeptidase N
MNKSGFLLLMMILLFQYSFSQNKNSIQKQHYELEYNSFKEYHKAVALIEPDTQYDVIFYHLSTEIAIDSSYISGNVLIKLKLLQESEIINFDLHESLDIVDISGDAPIENFIHNENKINLFFLTPQAAGSEFNIEVQYKGQPELAGGYKGLVYQTHGYDEPIIATLSTPFLSHYWWPCKDGPSDKADSIYVDITIKDTTINEIPVKAISNGILESVTDSPGKKTFHWKHRYPIVPYYVMAAISNYMDFSQQITIGEDSFPIDYYVFEPHLNDAMEGVAELPSVMEFFTDLFGPYPFRNEKYGMTQLGFYGGIENQTNTIQNSLSHSWFSTSVHELCHQWFGDMITCNSWHHGWLNEGFAKYSEALWIEHTSGVPAYQEEMASFKYLNDGTVYLEDDSDPFEIFVSIIYYKGAWVMHMLRGVLGDEDFFEAVKQYAQTEEFMYASAETEDFQYICENVSGLDLEYFFHQWIYEEYYPKYEYNWQQDLSNGQTGIVINQTQSQNGWYEVFEMPIQMNVSFMNGTDSLITVYNNQETQSWYYTFDNEIANISLDPDEWILRSVEYNPDFPIDSDSHLSERLILFPNPCVDILCVENPVLTFKYFTIIDCNGKIILSGSIDKSNQIDLSTLSSGRYNIRLSGKSEYTTSFIKK